MKDQIEQLKTELRKFIELSKTITPGKWESDGMFVDQLDIDTCIASVETVDVDANFIARSRNISPAMAECLLVAVSAIEHELLMGWNGEEEPDHASGPELRETIQQILTIWEASK
jgi:hypothetical protein